MIGGEHKKERFSERLSKAQNQPKHRGYIYGTELMTGGYTTNTLAGNWSEERADAGFYDGKPALPTDQEKYWTTTYRQMVQPATHGEQLEFNQETLIEIEDRTKSSYPAHQPHLDPRLRENMERAKTTTFTDSYQPPEVLKAAEQAYVPPVLGGVPGAQAYGVLLRFRRQLELQMPGRSAFPGNVTRTVRHALQESTTDPVTGEVNLQELQDGLARIGVSASVPECTALVRYYDEHGLGTASLYTIVKELRGRPSDRREQLTKSAYELLVSVCPDGIVRLDRMTELIDVAQLERVRNHEVTEEEARHAFAEQWDARKKDAYISLDTFMTFFGDASFEITGDGAFELMMRNIWHLSGGNGKSANTSCRRVRVVHRNGRITEEEAKNDITIPRGSGPLVEEKIRENLERQGIHDTKTMTILS